MAKDLTGSNCSFIEEDSDDLLTIIALCWINCRNKYHFERKIDLLL